MSDDVTEPLLTPASEVPIVRKPPRTIVVEPIYALFLMVYIASQTMNSEYIFTRLANERGFFPSENVSMSENSSLETCKSTSGPSRVGNTTHTKDKEREEIQAAASFWLMLLTISALIPGIISSIILGSYSDRAGRKITMLLPVVGASLCALVYVLVVFFNLPFQCMFIGNFIFGISGTNTTFSLSVFAYLADTTTKQARTFRIVVLEMISTISIGVGWITFGITVDVIGFFWSYLIILVVYICLVVTIIFLVPETVTKSADIKLISLENLMRVRQVFCRPNEKKEGMKMKLALLAFLLVIMTYNGDIMTLFMIGAPLCWNTQLIGYFNAGSTLVYALTGFLLTKPLCKVLSSPWVVSLGALSGMAAYIFLAFVFNSIMMWMCKLSL